MSTRSLVSNMSQPNVTGTRPLRSYNKMGGAAPGSACGQVPFLQSTVAPGALPDMAVNVARKMKKKAMREFQETLKTIRGVNADQLETMSQKASERLEELKQRKQARQREQARMGGTMISSGAMTPQVASRPRLSFDMNFEMQAKRATAQVTPQQPPMHMVQSVPTLPMYT